MINQLINELEGLIEINKLNNDIPHYVGRGQAYVNMLDAIKQLQAKVRCGNCKNLEYSFVCEEIKKILRVTSYSEEYGEVLPDIKKFYCPLWEEKE